MHQDKSVLFPLILIKIVKNIQKLFTENPIFITFPFNMHFYPTFNLQRKSVSNNTIIQEVPYSARMISMQ
jgi:hypothetical protein